MSCSLGLTMIGIGHIGTHVNVEPFHLFRYLDEQVLRYNNRTAANDGERFHKVN